MTTRRNFCKQLVCLPLLGVAGLSIGRVEDRKDYPPDAIPDFCRNLKPVKRILETEGYYVWCVAPIYGKDGKVHVFYSRWLEQYGMGGWLHKCEIAHAVADRPEGPYRYVDVALAPRPGYWDSTTCHNPHIQYIDGKYYLFYLGNSEGSFLTKRIGLAIANTLEGPWQRMDKPLLDVGPEGQWDDCITSNPAFLRHPNGENWLYYKSLSYKDLYTNTGDNIAGNRKYGLAVSKRIDGGYERYPGNPIIDFSKYGGNCQVEDAFVYLEDGNFKMLMRDMGYFDHYAGLIFESTDGINWSLPKIAWYGADKYFEEPPAPKHLDRYGRFERPQLLMKDGKPEYLFTAMQGGKYMTATGFVFRV